MRTGSVNTNQLGLKMSGCPSTVGKQGRIARYMGRRVDCMMGLCKPIRYHEVKWPRTRMRNQPPFCRAHATKCLAAAGGVGTNHNIPYYRIPKQGESGCTPAAVEHSHIHANPHSHGLTAADLGTAGGLGDQVGFARPGVPFFPVGGGGTLSPDSYEGVEFLAIFSWPDSGGGFQVVWKDSRHPAPPPNCGDQSQPPCPAPPFTSLTVSGTFSGTSVKTFTLDTHPNEWWCSQGTLSCGNNTLCQSWFSRKLGSGCPIPYLIAGNTYTVTFN